MSYPVFHVWEDKAGFVSAAPERMLKSGKQTNSDQGDIPPSHSPMIPQRQFLSLISSAYCIRSTHNAIMIPTASLGTPAEPPPEMFPE